MMISRKIVRNIYTSHSLWESGNKSLLATLRKKTGYTFSNCRKALELNENDVFKAELWLKEQAQALGWAKAQQVAGRNTTQGLIAAIFDKHRAALVEVNCETDFVARNEKFQGFTNTVTNAVLNYANSLPVKGSVMRTPLHTDVLKNLPAQDGRILADHAALAIGDVGENIDLKRALCIGVTPDIKLIGCTHPLNSHNESKVVFGKYGVLMAYKSEEDNNEMALQLCHHIIGLNPKKIGDPNMDQPNKIKDEETALIFQDYLMDSSMSVQQLLTDTKTEIIDFVRFEIGGEKEEQVIEEIETGG